MKLDLKLPTSINKDDITCNNFSIDPNILGYDRISERLRVH